MHKEKRAAGEWDLPALSRPTQAEEWLAIRIRRERSDAAIVRLLVEHIGSDVVRRAVSECWEGQD